MSDGAESSVPRSEDRRRMSVVRGRIVGRSIVPSACIGQRLDPFLLAPIPEFEPVQLSTQLEDGAVELPEQVFLMGNQLLEHQDALLHLLRV